MSFWQNKRVLVTGANGFLGSHLVKNLVEKKASVTTFSRTKLDSPATLIIGEAVNKVNHQVVGTITNYKKLEAVISRDKINIIYHLAALPLVELGQKDPRTVFEINIAGTWNVLEAARRARVDKIIPVSTTHVYGNNRNLPFKEVYYPQPSRPYETSKACADLLAQCYADSYSLNVLIPRFVNLYGPGDNNFTRLIPKVIRTILEDQELKLWSGRVVRDFLFIDDAIRALLVLAEVKPTSKTSNRIYNFGSGQPVEVLELAKQIINLSNPAIKLTKTYPPANRTNEIGEQYVSITKAKRQLNWRPTTNLTDGLQSTIDWYKRYLSHL